VEGVWSFAWWIVSCGEFSPRVMRVGWSLCGRVFWAMLVQECLERRFLPLQAGCWVDAGSGASYGLFQVPWSELKKFFAGSRE
jgi:hypothetical protein